MTLESRVRRLEPYSAALRLGNVPLVQGLFASVEFLRGLFHVNNLDLVQGLELQVGRNFFDSFNNMRTVPLNFKLDLLLLGQIILLIVELYVHFFKFNQFFLLLAFPPTNFILYYFIYLLDL